MKNIATTLLLATLCLTSVAIGLAQTGPRSSEGVLPPRAYLPDRDSSLEKQLKRLRDAEASMGERHPQLESVRKRIAELEAEVQAFRSIPNPFSRFEDAGVGPQEVVNRISEKELRVLVVRLAVDVKDLRTRVKDLEKALDAKAR